MGGKDGSNMVTIFKRFGDSCGATGSHLTNSEIVKGMITRACAKNHLPRGDSRLRALEGGEFRSRSRYHPPHYLCDK